MLEKNISADLMVIKTDETTQKTAQSLGMSVNHYLVYKRLMDKGLIVDPKASSSNNTSHMLAQVSTTINSLFPKESMTITPQSGTQQEAPNSMSTPMAGENMPSNSFPKSGSSQNQSPPNIPNTIPPSNHTKPGNPPMSSTPLNPVPMQGGSDSTSSSGEHNMMP